MRERITARHCRRSDRRTALRDAIEFLDLTGSVVGPRAVHRRFAAAQALSCSVWAPSGPSIGGSRLSLPDHVGNLQSMSCVITIYGRQGIVMASDSRLTLNTSRTEDGKTVTQT